MHYLLKVAVVVVVLLLLLLLLIVRELKDKQIKDEMSRDN
jgi:hypothetical protein